MQFLRSLFFDAYRMLTGFRAKGADALLEIAGSKDDITRLAALQRYQGELIARITLMLLARDQFDTPRSVEETRLVRYGASLLVDYLSACALRESADELPEIAEEEFRMAAEYAGKPMGF